MADNAFHFIKYSHSLPYYKALPETRYRAAALRMFWRLQFETKEEWWIYSVLLQFADFCLRYCSKQTTYVQTQCFHCSTWKPDAGWHSEVSKQKKIKSLTLFSLTCCRITSGTYYFPYLVALISTQQTFETQLCLGQWFQAKLPCYVKVDSHKKCVLVYWSVKIASWWGCWTVFPFWILAWIEIRPFRPH